MATVATSPLKAQAHAHGLSRSALFFWLTLVATLNSFAGVAARTVIEHGWIYSLFGLFEISAILWLALAAALAFFRNDACAESPRRADAWIGAMVIAVALVPVAAASSLSLTLLAAYLAATSDPGSAARRASIVTLAMTGSLIWGRLFLALFSRPLLDIDAFFVGRIMGTTQVGNLIAIADGSGRLAVAPGCSSWQGMSLAVVFWVTVNQWFRIPFGWRPLAWCVAAVAATIAINVLRIGAFVHFPAHFDAIHHGWGWHVASWATLAAICAICLYGARRDIFAHD